MEERDIKIMQESNYWHHAQVMRDDLKNGWLVQVVDRVRGERHFLETKRGSDPRVFMTADTAIRWCEKVGISEVTVLLGQKARRELNDAIGEDEWMQYFTVLLVEDDLDDQAIVNDVMQNGEGYNFRIVKERTLDDATRVLKDRQVRVDVVLLDLNLPDARGLGTLEAILSERANCGVIVVSNAQEENLAEQCLRKGAMDFIDKNDLSEDRLLQAVGFALAKAKQRRIMELESLLQH